MIGLQIDYGFFVLFFVFGHFRSLLAKNKPAHEINDLDTVPWGGHGIIDTTLDFCCLHTLLLSFNHAQHNIKCQTMIFYVCGRQIDPDKKLVSDERETL